MLQLRKGFRALAALTLVFVSVTSASNSLDPLIDETQEGWDVQSPAEIEAARKKIEQDFADATEPTAFSPVQRTKILADYAHLDPTHIVPTDLLEDAVIYFDANKSKFPNQAFITIVDFKKRSNKQRFFLIDMASGEVEQHFTTHGTGSDRNKDGFAESFGNVNGSGKSSLGFVRTGEVYWGKYRRSVRLDGLSTTNSNMRMRAVVFHGWDGVKEQPVIQGLSWGCITLDWTIKDGVLDKIKEGSLMYAGVSKVK